MLTMKDRFRRRSIYRGTLMYSRRAVWVRRRTRSYRKNVSGRYIHESVQAVGWLCFTWGGPLSNSGTPDFGVPDPSWSLVSRFWSVPRYISRQTIGVSCSWRGWFSRSAIPPRTCRYEGPCITKIEIPLKIFQVIENAKGPNVSCRFGST